MPLQDRKIAGEVSYREINRLMQNPSLVSRSRQHSSFLRILAETGKAKQASEKGSSVCWMNILYPERRIFTYPISRSFKDNSDLINIGTIPGIFECPANKIGVDAIRHMTLLICSILYHPKV